MTETRSVDVFDGAGKKTGAVELPAEVFDLELNSSLLHQVINAQLAAARQGTHATKTRSEVSGGVKRVPVAPARVRSAPRSGPVVVLSTVRSRVTIRKRPRRR